MKYLTLVMTLFLAFVVACGTTDNQPGGSAPTIAILSPKDGDTVNNPIKIQAAVTGVTLTPAGTAAVSGQGHLHVLIDVAIPPGGSTIPSAPNYINLADGASQATLPTLAPGRHSLTVVFTDSNQVVTNPVLAYTINVTVPGPTPPPPPGGTRYP